MKKNFRILFQKRQFLSKEVRHRIGRGTLGASGKSELLDFLKNMKVPALLVRWGWETLSSPPCLGGHSGSRADRKSCLRVPLCSPVRVLQLRRAAAWEYCSGTAESLLGIWHVITLGPLACCSWLGHMKAQTVPVSELKRTNTISISLTTMNARYFNEEYQEDIYKS